jgi:putative spermidine/putrescine transport system permease protein
MFWRRVGLPLLAPSLTEVGSLLFANAAAAYATPFALSGTSANVLAVRIAALVSGDIFAQPELAALLALVMATLLGSVLMMGRWWAARQRLGTLT